VLLLRVNPCAAPPSLPHVRWKSDLFGAVLECSRAKCRLFPRRTDRNVELWTRQDGPRSSGSATWLSGEKAEPFCCRIVRRKVHFFVVGGYPLVSGLTPAAESFSSPGLLEDSAHWTIAELCRDSSTPVR
jgi:hypothetical protein